MAAILLRVLHIFLLILLIHANSAKALQCYKCVSAGNESCKKEPGAKYLTVCDESVSGSESSTSTSASPPSSSGSGSSTASSSESSSSASPSSSNGASLSTTSTMESSSSASSLSSSEPSSSTASSTETSTSASAVTRNPPPRHESRQIRSLLLNRFEGLRQSEQAYYCFMHTYEEGETEVVQRGCTTKRNYCQEQEKKASCEICQTDECNSAANSGFMPLLLVFAAAATILR